MHTVRTDSAIWCQTISSHFLENHLHFNVNHSKGCLEWSFLNNHLLFNLNLRILFSSIVLSLLQLKIKWLGKESTVTLLPVCQTDARPLRCVLACMSEREAVFFVKEFGHKTVNCVCVLYIPYLVLLFEYNSYGTLLCVAEEPSWFHINPSLSFK